MLTVDVEVERGRAQAAAVALDMGRAQLESACSWLLPLGRATLQARRRLGELRSELKDQARELRDAYPTGL